MIISQGKHGTVPDNPVLQLFDRWERIILCLLLATMIILACLQIILRTFFNSGLLWADSLVRYLVLWCGLLGAVSATGQDNHVALDITGNKIPPTLQPWISLITHLFCLLAAGGLTWAGWIFLQDEIAFGGSGPLSLPMWFWNSIFPLAFGLITAKYLLLFFLEIKGLSQSKPQRHSSNS